MVGEETGNFIILGCEGKRRGEEEGMFEGNGREERERKRGRGEGRDGGEGGIEGKGKELWGSEGESRGYEEMRKRGEGEGRVRDIRKGEKGEERIKRNGKKEWKGAGERKV